MAEKQGFEENFQLVKETAQWFKEESSPNLDEMMERYQKAAKAYQECKERLEAAEKLFQEE